MVMSRHYGYAASAYDIVSRRHFYASRHASAAYARRHFRHLSIF